MRDLECNNCILHTGYDAEYGARPLKRAIQKYIEDPLAEEIINSKLAEGDSILIDLEVESGEIKLKVSKPKKKKNANDESKS